MPCWYEWNNARNESKSGWIARARSKRKPIMKVFRVIYFCCRRFFHPTVDVACNVCCFRASLKAPNTLIISSWWRLKTVIEAQRVEKFNLMTSTHWQHILFHFIVSSLLDLSKKLNACDHVEEFFPFIRLQIADFIQAWCYSNKFNSLFSVSRSSINFRWWKFFNFLFFFFHKLDIFFFHFRSSYHVERSRALMFCYLQMKKTQFDPHSTNFRDFHNFNFTRFSLTGN